MIEIERWNYFSRQIEYNQNVIFPKASSSHLPFSPPLLYPVLLLHTTTITTLPPAGSNLWNRVSPAAHRDKPYRGNDERERWIHVASTYLIAILVRAHIHIWKKEAKGMLNT